MANLLERVLVIGGSGQLGREICATFAGPGLSAPSHADLDIESPSAVDAAFERVRPTLAINLAAYHQVERCEEFPDRAFALNALAVDRLAAACALAGAAF